LAPLAQNSALNGASPSGPFLNLSRTCAAPSARLSHFSFEGDTALCLETLAHFVFYWLTRTEPIPEGERDIAHALGQRRLEYFNEQADRKVSDGT